MKLLKYILSLFLPFILSGCVKDNTDDCETVLTLRFVYEHNTRYRDLFAQDVDHVDLFIYDDSGKLIMEKNYPVNTLQAGNTVTLPLPADDYTIIAWGNLNNEDYRLIYGKDLHDMYLTLNCDGCDEENDVHYGLDNLFHGIITLDDHDTEQQYRTVYMIKNTNDIHVILEYTDPAETYVAPDTDFSIRIIGINGKCMHNNDIDARDITHTYMPTYSVTAGSVVADFRTLRITRYCDLELVIKADEVEIARNSIPELILKANPDMTDADFDRYDDFTFRYKLERRSDGTWAVISLQINDWDLIPGINVGI